MRKYPAAPHPFVLDLDLRSGALAVGSEYILSFTLIGRGNQLLPYMIFALQQAAELGIGAGRGRMSLADVEQQVMQDGPWKSIYKPGAQCEAHSPWIPQPPDLPALVTLGFETPLRLKRNEGLVGVKHFTFGALLPNLLRRISMLTYFHTDTPLETDFAGLVRAAKEVPIADAQLRWYDWSRYSSRQDREMALGGLLGDITMGGADLTPFWPYLWLGQYVHAGAVTSMGLGRYTIGAAASLPGQTAHKQSAMMNA
ncbi:MAG: CRISPR system precrRNA processing endoribonuclease RAMP protein Cas6 [Sulfuricaulis sp.]